MERELLSIVVPVYNGEKYLQETFDSLSKVSYRNLEIIIVDDGSKDGSDKIYQKYVYDDKRFRVIRQDNIGIAGARNRGMYEAKGEYIGFCDQDDIVEPNFYKKAIERMVKDDSDVCICSSARFYKADDRIIRIFEKQINAVYSNDEIGEKLILPGLLYLMNDLNSEIVAKSTIWNCIVKKRIIDEYQLKFRKNINYEDDTLMRTDILLKSQKVSTIEDVGYYWRTNLASESNRKVYIENIKEKQNDTRDYISKQMKENGFASLAIKYESYQKCFDMIHILENERAIKCTKRQRKNYLNNVMQDLNTEDIRKCSMNIKGIRFQSVLSLIRAEQYIVAYNCSSFLIMIKEILYKLKIAYFVANIIRKI